MEHAAFHLRSAGLNPKAITIWRSFGGIPVTSWAVLGPNDRALMWWKGVPPPRWHGAWSSPRRGTWGRGWGSSSPCRFRDPLGQTPARLTGGSRCCIPRGQESSRHPKKQGVLLMAGGASPELPGGGGGAAGLASTGVPIPRRRPGSGAGEPPAPARDMRSSSRRKTRCHGNGGVCHAEERAVVLGHCRPGEATPRQPPAGRRGGGARGHPASPAAVAPLAWRCLRQTHQPPGQAPRLAGQARAGRSPAPLAQVATARSRPPRPRERVPLAAVAPQPPVPSPDGCPSP